LSGLGGVGKTQTVVEYAHRHLAEYDHVFLATAASREALVSSYVTVAGLLKLPEGAAQDQILAVEAVKHWLSSSRFTCGRWRSEKRRWGRSTATWPGASTTWRSFTGLKANTRRVSPLKARRSRFMKRLWARSTAT